MRHVLAILLVAATHCEAVAFDAVGNTDQNHRAAPFKQGEVVVTFDLLPTKMSFDLPGYIKMVSENGIPYINGATESYIPDEGYQEGASYESWNDRDNEFSRMWIESRNAARIVVRHRCALMKKKDGKSVIIHSDKKKVAPYGPGNWVDEWYIFYPDGTHIRRIKIWNVVARNSGPHGKKWPYELEGMYLWWVPGQSPDGTKVSDHLEEEMITLIRMNGEHRTIDLTPYPLAVHDYANASGVYGRFANASIHVINTRSKYRPWRAGRPSDKLCVSPYVPVHTMTQIVPSFPEGSGSRDTYSVAGLGQMVYQDFWKLEKTTMSELWLNGWTDSDDPASDLSAVARSWWNAPHASLARRNGARIEGYDVAEKAYMIDASGIRLGKRMDLKLSASAARPLENPAFLVNNWGDGKVSVTVDGKTSTEGNLFRAGYCKELSLQDGRKWTDVLVLWLDISAQKQTTLSVMSIDEEKPGIDSVLNDQPYRTWRSLSGSALEARLVKYDGSAIVLETKAGKRSQISSVSLSAEDLAYFQSLKQKQENTKAGDN